jgi:cysteine desulfurase
MQMFNEPNYINSYKNHTLSIQKKLENFLENQGCVIFANQSKRLTNTTFFAMQNCKNSIQLVEYDLNNIFVSTGSACSSGKIATSHVLQSMNISKNLAENAIRISTDLPTTNEQIEKFFNVFLTIKARL